MWRKERGWWISQVNPRQKYITNNQKLVTDPRTSSVQQPLLACPVINPQMLVEPWSLEGWCPNTLQTRMVLPCHPHGSSIGQQRASSPWEAELLASHVGHQEQCGTPVTILLQLRGNYMKLPVAMWILPSRNMQEIIRNLNGWLETTTTSTALCERVSKKCRWITRTPETAQIIWPVIHRSATKPCQHREWLVEDDNSEWRSIVGDDNQQ